MVDSVRTTTEAPGGPSQSTSEQHRAVKAVIPAAGLATRFLPATKAVPKELLPVVDRPVLQYIVEEAANAGITDILLITGRGKTSMVDHFDSRPDLEARLREKGDDERLAAVKRPSELADIYTCRQHEPLGLGHAVGVGESHVAGEPFAVLLGDEFVDESEPLLPAMLELQARTGGIVLAFLEVEPDEVRRYGIASVEPAESGLPDVGQEVVRVTGLVEKPTPEEAPSNLAVLGRYVLPPTIFSAIKRVKPGSGGEIQLTDAMALLLAEGTPVHGVIYRGTRYDTGQPLGYLQAVVQLASQRRDIGPDFTAWLRRFVEAIGDSEGSARP
ncbi:UTP--glucose-1-phosphate uridylyltransferase [Planosporangium flavigriseum]|uniref:UTP--glucose-1-phosphate uridylyltransferase n=1 Tax=Planosporangium flavigriseum TaxID=373681 RepID=A0A8J3PJX7_9ACTN|nr:UTP--glucose-1-phosphate uridylyltransferase [Planosporangium flavigriseum]NJC63571.1 UTP--glucose-1-phosphate uridylyltransferase [Planosporangium flavigriseum]GIG72272.1 UTP--glucose-1-phosphate uridylyltransferase [Planosporangium flavigriseum]